MRLVAAFLLAGLLPLLQGCVAAAIPVVAGAAMAKTRIDKNPTPPVSPKQATPVRTASAADRSDLRIIPTSLSALPAPDAVHGLKSNSIQAFGTYAREIANLTPGQGTRISALLIAPGELNAKRAACGSRPLAVIVDLDPGRGTFDPLSPGQAEPMLGPVLADIRAQDIAVVWFSRLGENFADAARAALAAGGLDPTGQDTLILMSDIDDRKQTRRDAVAKTLCPIAILGDERADFDELYLYLKNPESAIALDASIGRGWFLASPFVGQQQTAFAGANP